LSGDVAGCVACDLTSGRKPLPGGVIVETGLWRVEHSVGPLGVGTLIIKPDPPRPSRRGSNSGGDDRARPVQPVSRDALTKFGTGSRPGPFLQVAMFEAGEPLQANEVEAFCDRARVMAGRG